VTDRPYFESILGNYQGLTITDVIVLPLIIVILLIYLLFVLSNDEATSNDKQERKTSYIV
jgi:uncharacterized membrane protein